VTFTSSSTAKNFAELLGNSKARSAGLLKHVQFASIGPVTSATLRELQMPVAIEAREFTMGGLIRAIVLARFAEASA
jgi:uroporphyrinogen-III synthase